MPQSLEPVIGVIRLEPMALERGGTPACDDSSLELLLASFAHHVSLGDDSRAAGKSFRLVSSRRLNWLSAGLTEVAVRANLVQLIDDLEAEFDRLSDVAS